MTSPAHDTEPGAPWPRPPLLGWPLIALRIGALVVSLILAVAAYYVFALFTRHNPAPPLFLRTLGAIAGLRLRVKGTLPGRGETAIFLSNHMSWLDIPALAGTTGCAFVAHDGLSVFAPLRRLCEMNDTVFIARHDRRSVAQQADQVRTALAETGSLTLFPEGTTSDGRGLLPFKSSLLSPLESDLAHVAIHPVWLDYGPQPEKVAWVGDEPGLGNALRILARTRPIPVTVHILPALTREERTSRKTIAQAARAHIAAVSGKLA
ncbi:lysophospholipid acyltransferase family protein [Novosphingobium sp. MBES04]|uniref:lysophospholipid acyltransferase family protein n=1 Tax=Novosphingobium sp. MBES04 TaxID=1206458 RepID=UPI001F5744FF|nr:lysophospholipid acyltransferase family protein [Novosphingobium sp. MBES04]